MGNWLKQIDEWMRRRIRMVFWKRWKRVKTRYRNLEKLGISHSNAGILANSRKGYWRIAGSPILNTALSNERLEKTPGRNDYERAAAIVENHALMHHFIFVDVCFL